MCVVSCVPVIIFHVQRTIHFPPFAYSVSISSSFLEKKDGLQNPFIGTSIYPMGWWMNEGVSPSRFGVSRGSALLGRGQEKQLIFCVVVVRFANPSDTIG